MSRRLAGLPGVEPGAKGDEALTHTGCPMYARQPGVVVMVFLAKRQSFGMSGKN